MEPHNHPPYEETFNRIATILDVIAGSQAEHADDMAEIRKIETQQEKTLSRHAEAMEQMRVRHDADYERLVQAMEKLTVKGIETEDKLNALIALMDHHLDDHRRTS